MLGIFYIKVKFTTFGLIPYENNHNIIMYYNYIFSSDITFLYTNGLHVILKFRNVPNSSQYSMIFIELIIVVPFLSMRDWDINLYH